MPGEMLEPLVAAEIARHLPDVVAVTLEDPRRVP
jgi:hypothetical protein